MPNYTTNLNLEKPLQTEGYDVDVFNGNADLIDAAVGAIEDDVAEVNTALDEKANAPIVAENVQILSTAWTQTDTYEDYPFSATATVTGMTTDMIPEVVFALSDATSGTFAPVAAPTVDGVTIYASEQVQDTMIIPTIIGWSKNA